MARHRGRGIASVNYPIGMNLGGDPSQALVHSNPGGKFTVAMTIQREIKAQRIDGLARWKADHLQLTKTGAYRLTESGQEEVASMLREVEQVREELKNDDF